MSLGKIEKLLQKGEEIENVLENYGWKRFENIISEIFEANGFYTKQNFRFKTKKRYEIDIIATKNNRTFCIDCKWWGRGRYKKTGLKNATVSQEKRVKELKKFLKKNPIARNMLKISRNYMINPLIITLHEEDMIKENSMFLVPVWKLNRFATENEQYF